MAGAIQAIRVQSLSTDPRAALATTRHMEGLAAAETTIGTLKKRALGTMHLNPNMVLRVDQDTVLPKHVEAVKVVETMMTILAREVLVTRPQTQNCMARRAELATMRPSLMEVLVAMLKSIRGERDLTITGLNKTLTHRRTILATTHPNHTELAVKTEMRLLANLLSTRVLQVERTPRLVGSCQVRVVLSLVEIQTTAAVIPGMEDIIPEGKVALRNRLIVRQRLLAMEVHVATKTHTLVRHHSARSGMTMEMKRGTSATNSTLMRTRRRMGKSLIWP